MLGKDYKGLFVLYVLAAVLVGVFLSMVWVSGGKGFGGDLEWAIIFGIFDVVLIASAIECCIRRAQRNVLQRTLVWGPLALAGIFLALTVLNGVING